jgi:hypothetical protein
MRAKAPRCGIIMAVSLLAPALYLPSLTGASQGARPGAVRAREALFSVSREEAQSSLRDYFIELARDVDQNEIAQARRNRDLIQAKIEQYEDVLTRADRKRHARRLKTITDQISRKVDSLIQVNLRICRTRGPAAAIEYRRMLTTELGVSQKELHAVDEAIVLARPARTVHPPEQKAASSAPHSPVQQRSPDSPAARPQSPPPASRTLPVKRSPEAADSSPIGQSRAEALARELRAEKELRDSREQQRLKAGIEQERGRLDRIESSGGDTRLSREHLQKRNKAAETAGRIEELLAEGNVEEAKTVFGIYRAQLRRTLDAGLFGILEERVENAYRDVRHSRERAVQTAADIFDLIEQGRGASAQARFERERQNLIAYLDRDMYEELQRKTAKAYSSFQRGHGRARKAAGKIRTLLTDGDVEEAYQTFSRSEPQLRSFLHEQEFISLHKEVMRAYDAMHNRRRGAGLAAREIRRLIAAKQGGEAYEQFSNRAADLRQHLPAGEFSALEREAAQAKRRFAKGRKEARRVAGAIRSELSREKIERAHGLFEEQKTELRLYLANSAFDSLRAEVRDAYAEWSVSRGRARRTARTVRNLIARNEGHRAHELFRKERIELRGYLSAGEYAALESAAKKARTEYRAGLAEARTTAKSIHTLLRADKPQQARARFKEHRSRLRHYLQEDNQYDSLYLSVDGAYKAFARNQRDARREMHKIARLIRRKQGDVAHERFLASRGLLAAYLEEKTLKELTADVAAAKREFRMGRADAKRTAARIRSMLAGKKTSQAYEAFDDHRKELRHYLDADEYNPLADTVDQAISALQDKRRDAARRVRAINRLMAHKEGAKAHALWKNHRRQLKKHLGNTDYRQLASDVAAAEATFRENVSKAVQTAAKIKSLAGRDSVRGAHKLYTQRRGFLKKYLYDNQFADLEELITLRYREMRREQRKAGRLSLKLRWMIWRGKGAEAREEFRDRRVWLRENLSAASFKKIETKIAEAYGRSRQKSREAAGTARDIRSMLARNRIDEAWELFTAQRGVLRRHLERAAYKKLEANVRAAYGELQDKRKNARSVARALRGMIKKKEAHLAYREFRKNRRNLKKYLDKGAYASLEQDIASARRQK